MKILVAHNQYQQKGGEDRVVAQELKLLQKHNINTRLLAVNNDQIRSTVQALKVAAQVSYSENSKKKFAALLAEEKPTLVHVHNFFPLLTPSIYDACQEAGIPVVQTLHNFRVTCANGLLLRNHKPCEKCITGSPFQAAVYGCYRNSRLASLPVAKMISDHRQKHTWQNKVARFIALTEFSKKKFIEAGLPAEKISVKPNFVNDPGAPTTAMESRKNALFIGRLSEEKGIRTLLKAWENMNVPLRIIGKGPMEEMVKRHCGANIQYLGFLSEEKVSEEIRKARFLVMPSEWYETFGLVIAEAFAHGVPVLASNLGSMAEIVQNSVNGVLFEAGNANDLKSKAVSLFENTAPLSTLSANARKSFETLFTESKNWQILIQIYKEVTQ